MATSRQIVLNLLIKMEKNGAYSNFILDNAFENEKIEQRDKAFAAALFYGVLERKITLDYLIRQCSTVEFDKLSPAAVQILRLGFYQLMYMTSVPESAVVNEAVKLAEDFPNKSIKGFVNAVLRNFIRSGKKIDYGTLEGIGKLSVEYSCPKWLVKKWTNEFGEAKTLDILKASLGRPPVYIKVNTTKCTAQDVINELKKDKIEAVRNRYFDDCLELARFNSLDRTNAYRKGMFHVQDISSQVCCRAVRPVVNETVLDMCAAPGGKSFTMAEIMENRGQLYSYDLYDGKAWFLENGAQRLGLKIIKAAQNDASVYSESIPLADKVLCDVPCSGLGVIRRKPEIKYKQKTELEGLPEIQKSILNTVCRYVKQGGTLVYSTCTISREENDEVVDDFLSRHSEFSPLVISIPGYPLEDNSYKRTILPSEDGGDGFFFATFRRIK